MFYKSIPNSIKFLFIRGHAKKFWKRSVVSSSNRIKNIPSIFIKFILTSDLSNFFIIQWIEKKLYVQYGSISSFQQVNLVDFYSFNIFYYESNWYSHAACLYRAPYLNINQKQMLVRQISHKKDFKCFRKLNWKSIIMSVRLMRRLINCLKFLFFSTL